MNGRNGTEEHYSASRMIFEVKFSVPREKRDAVLSMMRRWAVTPPLFPHARIRTVYFDDSAHTSFFESKDGELSKKKYRLREYVGGEGARYSLEIKARLSTTSKLRKLIYRDLPEGYRFTTFRDLISTVEGMEGQGLAMFRAFSPSTELFADTAICYDRFRFDDPYGEARYNLDTDVLFQRDIDGGARSQGLRLCHGIFEIKSPSPSGLPRCLSGLGLEPFSFSKFAWGKRLRLARVPELLKRGSSTA